MVGYEYIVKKGPGQTAILTKDFTTGFFFQRKLKGGVVVIVVKWYRGFLGHLTHVDVRNPADGQYFRKIPIDYFLRK